MIVWKKNDMSPCTKTETPATKIENHKKNDAASVIQPMATPEPIRNLDRKDQLYWWIGRFIVEFSRLEYMLKLQINNARNIETKFLVHDFG
jgi:hypothetical protein